MEIGKITDGFGSTVFLNYLNNAAEIFVFHALRSLVTVFPFSEQLPLVRMSFLPRIVLANCNAH